MALGSEGNAAGRNTAIVVGVGAVVVAGLLGWGLMRETPAQPPVTAEPVALAAPVQEPAAALLPAPPRFDVVRVDAMGNATIAGSAEPGSEVSLRVDGAEIARVPSSGQGQFASLFTLPPSDAPRLLSLMMILPDGREVAGAETVALAPIAAPAAVLAEASQPEAVAPEGPAALLVSPEGVRVLPSVDETSVGPDPAEQLARLTIDSIAYGADGAVLLGGQAFSGSVVRIYLDETALGDVVADGTGAWRMRLPEVAPGIYTLRADQIDGAGKVTARFETPFKREAPEALAAVLPQSGPAPAQNLAEAADSAPKVAPLAEPSALAVAPEVNAPQAPEAAPKPAPVSVTVQPGFTLWRIAEQSFGDGVMYVQVFEANKDKIRDPDLIYPGQVFTVPNAP